MKNSKPIVSFTVLATVLAAFNLSAADPILSQRAKETQVRKVPNYTDEQLNREADGSPKADAAKDQKVRGITENKLKPNPAAKLTSPKAQP